MSVNFLTGVPGSGKTYFAVNEISKALEKRNRPVFTNINLKIPYNDILQPLDIEDFYNFCSQELSFFDSYREIQSLKRKENPDYDEIDNYDEALKASGILDKYGNSYIVWDECHNDLRDNNPVYVRWLSYHRHYEGMDVLLITQSLDLVYRQYKRFADKFYFGVNPSKRLLSTTFKYKVYTDHREYSKHLIEEISLSSNKKVFDLYDSGHYKVNKSALLKKLIPIIVAVLFLSLFIKYVFFGILLGGNKSVEKELEQNSTVPALTDSDRIQNDPSNRTVEQMKQDSLNQRDPNGGLMPPPAMSNGSFPQSQSADNQSNLSRHLIRFQCSQTYCYFSGNRFTIPLNSLERFFEEFNGKILSAEILNRDISIITAVVPNELYYMIEAHNIVTRSDNYVPQNSNQANSTFTGFPSSNSGLSSPQFAPSTGI